MTTDATQGNPLDLFAKVVDGEIVEYPVYRMHIINRGLMPEWYVRVEDLPKPKTVPAFSQLVTKKPYVKDGHVYREWAVVALTLPELLATLATKDEQGNVVPLTIDKVPVETVERVRKLVSDYITTTFSKWAATRGYGDDLVDPFISMLGYMQSSDAEMNAEANCGHQLRDTAWAAYKAYFKDVLTGVQPVPITMAPINALIPPLKWPDEA